jgi:hypothetical protein
VARALDDGATRWALRRRVRRGLGGLGLLLAGYTTLGLLIAGAAAVSRTWLAVLCTVGALAFAASIPLAGDAVAGVLGAGQMWFLLGRNSWRSYRCRMLVIGEGRVGVVRLIVWDPAARVERHLTLLAGRRRETLRGMSRPDVWLAGDPARRVVLVPSGGGEMFLAHRDRAWEWAQATGGSRGAGLRADERPVRLPGHSAPGPAGSAARDRRRAAAAAIRARTAAPPRFRLPARQDWIRDLLPWRRRPAAGPPGGGRQASRPE